MKNFQQYLAESERTYNYRIKIVGDVDAGWIKQLEDKCKQFDIVKWSGAKTSPVQLKPADFPKHSNDSVTSIDVEFRYPAIEPQIKQLARLIGLDENRIVMNTLPYEEGLNQESTKIEDQNKDLLTDTNYPAPDKQQNELSATQLADFLQQLDRTQLLDMANRAYGLRKTTATQEVVAVCEEVTA